MVTHFSTPATVSVIIVSYNTADHLMRCLDAVAEQAGVTVHATVVDNASADGSPEAVRRHHPGVDLIANTENLGFGRANNQVIRNVTDDYIVFLNPDTQLQTDALMAMVAYMERHPDVGLAGGRLANPDGSHQASVEHRYPGQRYTGGRLATLPGTIAWVMGAFMIVRRDLVKEIGGFDEQFFLYGEDIDLCLSIRQRGWAIGYADDAVAIHWGGESERDSLPEAVMRKKYAAEIRFYEKHYTAAEMTRIKRKTRLQALWRLAGLTPQMMVAPRRSVIRDYHRYRLAWQMFR
ncbi:MAG: glycosyltransferase family 2 protein [Pseudomonadota bacterium]